MSSTFTWSPSSSPYGESHRPELHPRWQKQEQEPERGNHAGRRINAKGADRHQVAGVERNQSRGRRAGRQRAGQPRMLERASRSAFDAALGHGVAIVVGKVNGARDARHVNHGRHGQHDGVHRRAGIIDDRQAHRPGIECGAENHRGQTHAAQAPEGEAQADNARRNEQPDQRPFAFDADRHVVDRGPAHADAFARQAELIFGDAVELIERDSQVALALGRQRDHGAGLFVVGPDEQAP